MKKILVMLGIAALVCSVSAQNDEFARPNVEEMSKVSGIEGEREFQKTENFIDADKKNKDGKPIVAVGLFSQTVESPFAKQISAKVEEVLKKTQRFQMPDRLNYESVQAELEFQKSQIDSDNLVQQGAALGADYIASGHINKLTVFQTPSGFSASVAFTAKVANVETGEITNETAFTTGRGRVVLSAESAINAVLVDSVEAKLLEWTAKDFPTTIAKLGKMKKGNAKTVKILGGESYGYKPKDKFLVMIEEEIGGQKMQSTIGMVKIKQLEGAMSEAKVKKGKFEIADNFKTNKPMNLYLQRK